MNERLAIGDFSNLIQRQNRRYSYKGYPLLPREVDACDFENWVEEGLNRITVKLRATAVMLVFRKDDAAGLPAEFGLPKL